MDIIIEHKNIDGEYLYYNPFISCNILVLFQCTIQKSTLIELLINDFIQINELEISNCTILDNKREINSFELLSVSDIINISYITFEERLSREVEWKLIVSVGLTIYCSIDSEDIKLISNYKELRSIDLYVTNPYRVEENIDLSPLSSLINLESFEYCDEVLGNNSLIQLIDNNKEIIYFTINSLTIKLMSKLSTLPNLSKIQIQRGCHLNLSENLYKFVCISNNIISMNSRFKLPNKKINKQININFHNRLLKETTLQDRCKIIACKELENYPNISQYIPPYINKYIGNFDYKLFMRNNK